MAKVKKYPLLPIALALALGVAYYTWQVNRSKSPVETPQVSQVVTNACSASFAIPTPKPSPSPSPSLKPSPSPSPSPTPKPSPSPSPLTSICRVRFQYDDHQTTCEPNAKPMTITYFVDELPPGGPYYMQTDWYVAAPVPGPNHYQDSQLITAGKSYSFTYEWPGINTYNPRPDTVEVHLGLNVVDANKNILTPDCSTGLDMYWTKWMSCPGLSTTTRSFSQSFLDRVRNFSLFRGLFNR